MYMMFKINVMCERGLYYKYGLFLDDGTNDTQGLCGRDGVYDEEYYVGTTLLGYMENGEFKSVNKKLDEIYIQGMKSEKKFKASNKREAIKYFKVYTNRHGECVA